MASSLSIPECVEFGFYSDEEIRSLSVCKITEEVTFDSLGHATPNGLYDARMGPTDFDQGLCPTCGNNFSSCPGHAGHIELKLPVYHPMLFGQLHKVLNTLCFNCHRFRLRDAMEGEEFRVRMELLNCGLVRENKEMQNALLSNSSSSAGETVETRVSRREAIIDHYDRLAHAEQQTLQGKPVATTHFTTARREAIAELIRTCQGSAKCGLCGTAKMKIRKAGNTKLFKSAKDSAEEQYFPPSKALQAMKSLWKHADRELAKLYLGPDYHKFFCHNLFVPPSRFRPARRTGSGVVIENAQTKLFVNVLTAQQLLLARVKEQQAEMMDEATADEDEEDAAERLGQTMRDWSILQDKVNCLMDDAKAENPARNASEALPGIRQLMEKKEGLFRQNLMGKRVNFACRSVISPDPMIGTDEIGVPLKFAKILTYAEPVTAFNVKELADLVRNGADVHPGACYLEDSAGRLIDLKRRNDKQRQELAARLEESLHMETSKEERELKSKMERIKGGDNATEASSFNRIRSEARAKAHEFGFQTKVWRHLRNGDVMLANRQPTLHKSSIMAHSARVIDNIKMQTIRMHYANCYSYNADFDGDEINLHFPQNELARSEGYEIAYTNHNYCAPTDGVPMRGLIQDHLSMGVLLSKRDIYFDRETMCQLAFSATAGVSAAMELPPPAVFTRDTQKWTGKQLVSLVMRRVVPESKTFCLFNSKAKTPANAFQVHNIAPPAGEEAWAFDGPLSDTRVSFLNGEMISGILDKNAFGNSSKYGYVHSVFEAYGAKAAGELLSALGRLFTHLERMWGHTCSMDDLVLNEDAERQRTELILQGEMIGVKKSYAFTQGGEEDEFQDIETVRLALSEKIALSSNSKLEEARLDGQMQGVTSKIQSNVMKTCVPFGQLKRFPTNSFSLMVMTGAKGSNVNQSQISCMLGQQSLEGRRVPRTAFGKTLPCFDPFDPSPRAGGFVTNRFLSGIRPQEYYFHCMAGREGLLDTAVKTARSGYLQRCMVKHLEHLKVSYDRTVRADDGSIVQFLYGDDGMDAMNVPYVCGNDESLRFLRDNPTSFAAPQNLEKLGFQRIDKKKLKRARTGQTDPLLSSENIDATFGILPESLEQKLDAFIDKESKDGEEEEGEFRRAVQFKFLKSLVAPGEPVGVLAAQGIGEPSTQMTLNTFHLAGHSTTNVTLGIPRLRELLWARAPGKTPTIKLECTTLEQAQHVASRLTRVVLSDLTLCDGGGVVIRELMIRKSSADGQEMTGKQFSEFSGDQQELGHGTWFRRYHIRYQLQPLEMIQEEFNITLERIAESVSKRLVNKLIQIIGKEFKRITGVAMKAASTTKKAAGARGDDDEDEDEAPDEDNVFLDDEAMEDEGGNKSDNDDEDEEEAKKSIVKKQANNNKKKKKKSAEEDEEEEAAASAEEEEKHGEEEEEENGEEEDDEKRVVKRSKTSSSSVKLEGGLTKVPCSSTAQCLRHVATGKNSNKTSFVEVCLEFPADSRRILLVDICDQLAKECAVRSVEGILDALAFEEDGKYFVNVAGVSSNKFNLKTMWKYDHMGDIKSMQSNDINAVLKTLGVEAARTCLIGQFQAVFDPYGIDIDERHLALVADHMLFEGDFKGLNRHGIEFSTSPLLRITFETAVKFVFEAALLEDQEMLQTPSARIATGQVIKSGTGSFGLVVKPIEEKETTKKKKQVK